MDASPAASTDVPRVPSVSVVVAAYNAERTIEEALEGVGAQTVAPLEVIVVDDGSSDATAQRADRSDIATTVLRKANAGPSAARNTAIAIARGEWIALLDADDRWHPRKLEHQLEIATRHPTAAIVACDWARSVDDLADRATRPCSWLTYRDLLVLNRFQTSTVLIRADVLRAIGGFDPSLDGVEDWDCWLRASLRGPVILEHAPLVFYRDSPDGVSKDLRRLRRGALAILRRERARGLLEPEDLAAIEAWHVQRILIGELLAHDVLGSALAFADLPRSRPWAHYAALRWYLTPFLRARLTRRRGPAVAPPGGATPTAPATPR